jgi:phosphonate transport system substrate-binding protein
MPLMKTLFFIFCCLLLASGASSAADIGQPLTFGLPPYANPATLLENFSPLAEYLAKKTGRPVILSFSPNYSAHVVSLGRGKVDIGFAGPSPYVKAKDKFGGVELLAKLHFENLDNDQMVIVTSKESPIKKLGDLRGKSFVFGDFQSYGSHFMPRFLLHSAGVSLRDLTIYDYVNNHDNVVLSVLHGDFDAGGLRFDLFRKYRDRPLRIIAGPVQIPPHVLVCRASLPHELKKTLREALLSLQDQRILKKIDPAMRDFLPVRDEEFDRARKIMDFIEAR